MDDHRMVTRKADTVYSDRPKHYFSSAGVVKTLAVLLAIGAIYGQIDVASTVGSGSVTSAVQATQLYSAEIAQHLVGVCNLLALLVWAVVNLTDAVRNLKP
jgi:hypothetical protein